MTRKIRLWLRIALTLFLVAASYLCFTLPSSPRTDKFQIDPTHSIEVTNDNAGKFYEWVGLTFLAFAVWIWRDKLGVTSVGPFSGPSIEQKSPAEIAASAADIINNTNPPATTTLVQTRVDEDRHKKSKEYIIQQLHKQHAVSERDIAFKLGITMPNARSLLYELIKEGILREDGFPKHSVYTLTSSVENLAIDRIRDNLRQRIDIVSERRFVRIGHTYEADAMFECESSLFIVEVKQAPTAIPIDRIAETVERLQRLASQFPRHQKIYCILALVINDAEAAVAMKSRFDKLSFNTNVAPIDIQVFIRDDLTKKQKPQAPYE